MELAIEKDDGRNETYFSWQNYNDLSQGHPQMVVSQKSPWFRLFIVICPHPVGSLDFFRD